MYKKMLLVVIASVSAGTFAMMKPFLGPPTESKDTFNINKFHSLDNASQGLVGQVQHQLRSPGAITNSVIAKHTEMKPFTTATKLRNNTYNKRKFRKQDGNQSAGEEKYSLGEQHPIEGGDGTYPGSRSREETERDAAQVLNRRSAGCCNIS